MYKKKDLMSILDIVNDYPKAATLQLRNSLEDMIAHPRKNPKFSKSEKDVLRLLYYKIIYSDKKYEPGQTALEQILQISRIEDKYHEIGIYTEEDFWEAVFESAEAVKDGIYGFRMNNTAFSRDGEPARVFLVKYKDKYIVYTSEEYDGNYYPEEHLSDLEHDLFDDYNEAEKYFQALENAGLLSGKDQIKNCKTELDEPNAIYIKSYPDIYCDVYFRVYYCRKLIMDHVGSLDPQKINQAVADYKKFCEDNHVSITDIYKKHPWNSNQRYYVVEMCENGGSRKTIYIHIPSALQRRQRNVIDLIKPNNIVQEMR